MDHKERDSILCKKMLGEITDIECFVSGMSQQDFSESKIAQKAVVMSLINIGELSKALSDEYLENAKEIPWKAIRGMRNIAAHHYEAIRVPNIWLTIREDLPILKQTLMNKR